MQIQCFLIISTIFYHTNAKNGGIRFPDDPHYHQISYDQHKQPDLKFPSVRFPTDSIPGFDPSNTPPNLVGKIKRQLSIIGILLR